MKFKNTKFLAKANIKGNPKSTMITVSTCFLVILMTLVSCYTIATTQAVDNYKHDYRARALELDPWTRTLDKKAIEEISNVSHVQSVVELKGLRNYYFNITNISGNNDKSKKAKNQLISKESAVDIWGLIGNEKREVIQGQNLEETPEFSCIIPSLFNPTGNEEDSDKVEYIDVENLIGKTITVKGYNDSLSFMYNYSGDENGNKWLELPAVEFKLKIVGVYYCAPTGFSYDDTALVSEKTAKLIQQISLKAGGYDLSSKDNEVTKWWNTPKLHTHYVVVDNYENIPNVYNEITNLGYCCSDEPEIMISDSITLMANLFKNIGVLLVCVLTVFTVMVLANSAINSLKKRKSEFGLMKAMGYKNRQIFFCLFYEQISLTIKAFILGGLLSSIFILIMNFVNSQKSYIERLYIIDWSTYLIFLSISLVIAVFVPLLCQVILLRRLNKIQPKDAMNNT